MFAFSNHKNRQTKKTILFWRVIISAVGIALILIPLVNVLLFFYGEKTTVQVTTRRYGGADDGRTPNQRYTWSIDYTFVGKNGKTYSGHTTRPGSDMSVKFENKAYYLRVAPYINTLETEAEPNTGHYVLSPSAPSGTLTHFQ